MGDQMAAYESYVIVIIHTHNSLKDLELNRVDKVYLKVWYAIPCEVDNIFMGVNKRMWKQKYPFLNIKYAKRKLKMLKIHKINLVLLKTDLNFKYFLSDLNSILININFFSINSVPIYI